jgi:myo-inositol-1-phosphate synthase
MAKANKIRVAIAGVGNCANYVVSGIQWYKEFYGEEGLMRFLPGEG